MAKVRIGPFSDIHFSKLAQKLEAGGAQFEKVEDPAAAKAYAEQEKRQSPTVYPVFSGHFLEYIFIEVEKEYLMLIKKDLVDLGYSLSDEEPLAEIPEAEPKVAAHPFRSLVALIVFISLALGYLLIIFRK